MAGSKPKVSLNASSYDKKYFQLWRRFYEPLVMLKILGSTRGEHSAKPEQPSPVHRFLDNLAYLSDHVKGGSTTSAIGLENAPKRFNFWIASNEPKQSDKSASKAIRAPPSWRLSYAMFERLRIHQLVEGHLFRKSLSVAALNLRSKGLRRKQKCS